jgi:hypothetical protein
MTRARDLADNSQGSKPKIVDAKGDLLVGTAADTVAALGVTGPTGSVLTINADETTGLKWDFPGKVLQVQYTATAGEVSWGDTNTLRNLIQATITPKLSTSDIYIFATVNSVDNAGNGRVVIQIVHNTTSGGTTGTDIGRMQFAQNSSSTTGLSSGAIIIKHSPASTATRYYKIIYEKGDAGGTNYINRFAGLSTIIAVEVAP